MQTPEPSLEVLKHVVDVHCHPTDSDVSIQDMDNLDITICAMATTPNDQGLVADLGRSHPEKVIPCFGYHPWFTHWISVTPGPPPQKDDHYRSLFRQQLASFSDADASVAEFESMLTSLPDPLSLDDVLSQLQNNLRDFPQAMLGEVGLDRSARVPIDYREERRQLTRFTVPFDHQMTILEAQLSIAVELKRNVSLHSVKSPKPTLDLLSRMHAQHGQSWLRISIDLHSCGLSPEMWKDVERHHPNVFLSLSTAINGRSASHKELIKAVSPTRLLVESDIPQIGQCSKRTWDMLCIVADVRGWKIEDSWEGDIQESNWGAVRRIESNWKAFVAGGHEHDKKHNGR